MRPTFLKPQRTNCLLGFFVRNYFISTPIFYVNASPHIGHLYSVVIADTVHRFQLLNGARNSIFSSGTDEHGLKVVLAAKKVFQRNKVDFCVESTQRYCDKVSSEFSSLFTKCNIKFTNFVRTTDPRHLCTVEKFWNRLVNNGYIYEGYYSGWYCISDEAFLKQSQLKEVRGEGIKEGKTTMISAESGQPAEWTEEKNYMFKMSSFKDDLLYWLKDEKVVQPTKFHRILRSMVEEVSLGDLSVSRPSERIHWGIPVPGDPSQCIYVWVDALANYLTAADIFNQNHDDNSGDLKLESWPPNLQVIGKDILKFHGIYWPSLLMAAGLEPPKTIFVHSHWTVNGEKMSKSRGNVVDPFDRIERYTPDGLRYFLLREGVAHSDGNYNDEKIIKILNAELADTFGNLLNRCTGSSLNVNQEFPSLNQSDIDRLCTSVNEALLSETSKKLVESLTSLPERTKSYYSNQEFNRVVDAVMDALRNTNRFFEAHRPWDAAKQLRQMKSINNEASDIRAALNAVLALSMESLRVCGIILQPIIPTLSSTLLDKLAIPKADRMWSNASKFSWEGNGKSANPLTTGQNQPLFKRILKVSDGAGS